MYFCREPQPIQFISAGACGADKVDKRAIIEQEPGMHIIELMCHPIQMYIYIGDFTMHAWVCNLCMNHN